MKSLLKNRLLLFVAGLQLASFCFAGLTAEVDESTNAQFQQIVVQAPNSVTVTFINDDALPWTFVNNGIQSPSMQKNQATRLSVSFVCDMKTEVQFSMASHSNSGSTYNRLEYYIDGVYQDYANGSSSKSCRFFLEAGAHIISFRDSVTSTSTNNYGRLTSMKVRAISPLETAVLQEGSMPLTFMNDGDYPWTIEDGYIQNGNYGNKGTTSVFSTTFTIDQPSIFSFEKQVTNSSSSSSYGHKMIISGLTSGYSGSTSLQSSWNRNAYALPAGTYTIVLTDTCWSTSTYYSRIRNISLTSDWAEVELAYPGTLGSEVLGIFDVLTDAELLKIKGNMNSTDWSTLGQMTQLRGLDLSEVAIADLPANAFSKLTQLTYVVLPEGMTSIGSYAFQNTRVNQLRIPASVTTINDHAFYQQERLCEIILPENTELTTIATYAFSGCTNLKHVYMPNTVTSVGTYAFSGCTSLDSIILSEALTTLPTRMCSGCYNLKYIRLPKNVRAINSYCFSASSSSRNTKLTSIYFPSTLKTINEGAFGYYSALDSIILPLQLTSLGAKAFDYCIGTTYIQLPSYISDYDYTFEYCSALSKVVCPSATPPTRTNDPFANGKAKSGIILEVPSFAVTTYKLDSYWNKFGNIVAGEDQDYWSINNTLVLSDTSRMSGSPTISLTTSGRLLMTGSAPFNISLLSFVCSSSSTSALLNANPSLMADSVVCQYSISEANKWYFVTPLYDTKVSQISHDGGAQYIFRYYDAARRAANGTGSSWQNLTDSVLHRGQGYILQSNGTGVLTFHDVLHQAQQQMFAYEDFSLPLASYEASSAANENWNFIGNPYPCYYDIWYLDFTTPITVWTGSTYKAYSILDDNYALRPMQAFFVQKPSTHESILFREEGRQVTSSISHGSSAPSRSNAGAVRQLINLSIAGADVTLQDETRVVINPYSSMDYEMTCDASKFMSMEPDVPQIFSMGEDGVRMSINERPIGNGIVALGCYLGNAGEYTITSSAKENVYLIDNLLNRTHNFADGDYTFTADESGDVTGRFYLRIIQSPSTQTALPEQSEELLIKPFAGGFAIDCSATDAAVYTVDGRLIARCSAGQGWARMFVPAGVYVIRTARQTIKQVVE